jgi:hypothetical protein
MIRKHRFEIVLVVLIVLTVALYVRWDAIPVLPDRHIAGFEETYGVNVGAPGPWFSAWALGDGQAYALIGIDPTGQTLAEEIREAGYRFARAGYGWAVWAVSLGQPELVPYALAIVGSLSLVALVALVIRLRPALGPRIWLIVFNPALFIGFAADTSEPMGILLLAVVLSWGGWWAASLLGVTRPTFLVALWGRWKQLAFGLLGAVGLGLYSLIVFGLEAMIPSGGRLGLPFHAYFEYLSVWGLLLAGAAAVTVAVGARMRDWSWVLAGVFVLCFGSDVLRDPVNAWRAAGFLPVLWGFGPDFRSIPRLATTLHPVATDADVASRRGGR